MSTIRQEEAEYVPLSILQLTGRRTIALPGIADDGFIYPADTETERWRRTDDIIERVRPGPHEDGVLFERLARQAATIEMSLRARGVDDLQTLQRVLVGTVGRPTARANSQLVGDHVVVTISAGTAYLIQRCAEAVARLSQPSEPAPGMSFNFSNDVDELRRRLPQTPDVVNLVAEPLLTWLYEGSVSPPGKLMSSAEQFWTAMVEDLAYRFVLAHEYAHVLVDLLAVPGWADGAQPDPDGKEIGADGIALQVVGLDAEPLDRVAKNIAVLGPALAMKAREITERAVLLAREGEDVAGDRTSAGQLFQKRLAVLHSVYQTMIAPGSDDTDLDMEPAMFAVSALEAVYERIAARIRNCYAGGARLHSTWELTT